MADYYPAEIAVGGALAHADRIRLAEAVVADGAGADWGAPMRDAEEALRAIDHAAQSGEPLQLFDDQARYGAFPAVEALCRETGLAFSRSSEARYENEAERVSYEPDSPGSDRVFSATQDGEPCLVLSELESLLNEPDPLAALRETVGAMRASQAAPALALT